MSEHWRRLSLVKGRHRYVFQYADGCEPQLVGSLVALASDPEADFDWFDAAVLSYEMGRRVESDSRFGGEWCGQQTDEPGYEHQDGR